jgi:hypothetical protein
VQSKSDSLAKSELLTVRLSFLILVYDFPTLAIMVAPDEPLCFLAASPDAILALFGASGRGWCDRPFCGFHRGSFTVAPAGAIQQTPLPK